MHSGVCNPAEYGILVVTQICIHFLKCDAIKVCNCLDLKDKVWKSMLAVLWPCCEVPFHSTFGMVYIVLFV